MIFNSVTYVVFLSLVVAAYWALPLRGRQWLVFAASIVFYGFWRFDFAAVMLFSALTDFVVSQRLARTEDEPGRKRWLLVSLVVNLGLLFYFKYLGFALGNLGVLAQWAGLQWHSAFDVVLPLGISFYTFQTISYTVDVYRRRLQPLDDFVLYGCYVTFFPQLVAGPILRASEVVAQLATRQRFSLDLLNTGLRRILFGLLLKVGFADNIAPLVDAGFSMDPKLMSALDVWTLAFLFGFQIYFDFAGYSHIALGSGRLMGIVFPENFNFPYLATSPKDFWRRWHISLSSWIRDYLYLPLAGIAGADSSRGGLEVASRADRDRALFIAWALMGFWHGAAWNFLIWGVYHAVVVFVHRKLSPRFSLPGGGFGAALSWGLTLPVMMLGWVPFRAESVDQTLTMWARVLSPRAYLSLGMRENTYLVTALVFLIVSVAGVVWGRVGHGRIARHPGRFWPAQVAAYALLVGITFIFLRPVQQFIYFQF